MIDYNDVEEIIEKCFAELDSASRERYDGEKADRTASLFLVAQMKVSLLIEDVEMKAKLSKNEISRIEGEKYFEYKMSGTEKKTTEGMLSNYVAKDKDVSSAKNDCAKFEATLKKWNYILDTLKNGHIYYRNLGKNKNWSE